MAFLLFKKVAGNGNPIIIRPTGELYALGGYNLIFQAWQQQGSPLDTGWHVTADELIRLHTGNVNSYSDRRLVIDFDPNATWRIGLIELLDIYAFTWGDGNGGALWTPLMLRMRDIYYEEFDQPFTALQKHSIIKNLPEPNDNLEDFVEFLYLNGSAYGWNWGKNGMTNAAFIQGAARDYFRQFF
ncbi:MAG: hypothetical protein AB1545_16875 [Thermodesulfobacteriota bacterium]